MRIDLISCIVGMRQQPEDEGFDLTVNKTGNQAIRVTEVNILQDMNGMNSVWNIKKVGEVEVQKGAEHARLLNVYKSKHINRVYPSPATPMPKTIEDLDVERSQFAKVESKVPADEAFALRQELKAMGMEAHPRTGVPKLKEMLAEAQQVGA